MIQEPIQPAESTWRFVDELQSPLWTDHHWAPREAHENEASLANGVRIEANFPDPGAVLDTAYEDLHTFLQVGGVPLEGDYIIETQHGESEGPESFRVEVTPQGCRIIAADTEGIRRAIFHLEDEMLSAGGPFLSLGTVAKKSVIRTRISRCFFGPLNRPPKNRDELADDVNYYPDHYLNRLAHDGVNGLWLTIKFRDMCRTRFFPEHGATAPQRLEKLRQTVNRCARYGIKIYIFCIEPMAFGDVEEYMAPRHELAMHPELAGHGDSYLTSFCTSSETGQQYLEDATYSIFSQVPGLGGLIGINLGERPTHCYSSLWAFDNNNCPRCSKMVPGEVFAMTLKALARGIHRADPNAEQISWLYVPYLKETPESDINHNKELIRQIAAYAPDNVIVQVNFESNGLAEQAGETHMVCDYSLAYVGPSDLFENCAIAAVEHGARVSAKLQVGCSHEVATVPFVPVPGNLYRKYSKMHELGVSSAMQCWFFGNYPSIMNKSAGLLGFAPLPATEDEFLAQLARIDWRDDAPTVVEAWKNFRDAYGQFPVALAFSWFGPVHDSISWPLHLIPVDKTISPSWLIGWPLSGDRVAECFAYELRLGAVLEICRNMAAQWETGVRLLKEIAPRYEGQRERQLDIGVAEALGLQLRSAYNVINFYNLREELPYLAQDAQLQQLHAMRAIVEEEIMNGKRLAALATLDSRLGFHSEAEGYKYFPEKLTWRAGLLEELLQNDFPQVEAQVRNNEPLFPTYTGAQPEGPLYRAANFEDLLSAATIPWAELEQVKCNAITSEQAADQAGDWATSWQAAADRDNFYFRIVCKMPTSSAETAASIYGSDHVQLTIEPRRLWPTQAFMANGDGKTHNENKSTVPNKNWKGEVQRTADGWEVLFSIARDSIREAELGDRPMRINVERKAPAFGTLGWLPRNPLEHRLIFAGDNPEDYGWLLFEKAEVKSVG